MPIWERVSVSLALDTPWLKVLRKTFKRPLDGTTDDYITVERDDFVLLVVWYGEKLVLVEQFRHATERSYLALPAGYVGSNESIEAAATREIQEETGIRITSWRRIGTLDPLPGYVKSAAHVLWARSQSPPVSQGDDEVDRVLMLPREDVKKLITSGRLNEMQAVAAILLAEAMIEES